MDSDLIYAGQEIMVPRGPAWAKNFIPKARTYEVVKGDTFWGIANKFGIKVKDIQTWNELESTELIYPGQVLKIVLETGVDL